MVCLGQVGVVAALGHHAAQPRGGVVFHLLALGLGEVAAQQHRRGSSGVGAGSHRRHVGRLQQEEARAGGPASAGSYVGDHRYARGDDLLVNLAARNPSARRAYSGGSAPRRRFRRRPGRARGSTISTVTGAMMPSTSTAITRRPPVRGAASKQRHPADSATQPTAAVRIVTLESSAVHLDSSPSNQLGGGRRYVPAGAAGFAGRFSGGARSRFWPSPGWAICTRASRSATR